MVTILVPMAGILLAATSTLQDYSPAPAQFDGEIATGDPTDARGRRYDEYPVELARGQRIAINVAPRAGSRFAPSLELLPAEGGAPLSYRAIQGANRSVSVGYAAPRNGVVLVRVSSSGSETGRYTLTVRPGASAPNRTRAPSIGTVAPAPPTPGDPVTGSVTAGPRSRFIICPGHPRCPRR